MITYIIYLKKVVKTLIIYFYNQQQLPLSEESKRIRQKPQRNNDDVIINQSLNYPSTQKAIAKTSNVRPAKGGGWFCELVFYGSESPVVY